MYGMVHLGLATMVRQEYDRETWQLIADAAGYPDLAYVSNEKYPDEVTFALVGAAATVLHEDPAVLLRAFGRYWVNTFAAENYGTLLDAAGDDFPTFVGNLNDMHMRIALIFPGYQPPRFEITDETESSLRLSYYSHRDGLAPFLEGLLVGIGDRFDGASEVEHVTVKGDEYDHDVFLLRW